MLEPLRYHYQLMRLALCFYTRIPVDVGHFYNAKLAHKANLYLPFIGWLLAIILLTTWFVISPVLGIAPTIFIILLISLLLTGAMHEDGLADTCDGFWGSSDKQKKLAIMKDSQLGTYGVCALVMSLLGKFTLLWQLGEHNLLVLSLCIAYPLSRVMCISHIQSLPYVSGESTSKSQDMSNPLPLGMFVCLVISGIAALFFVPTNLAITIALTCLFLSWLLNQWMRKHIGGYTGDTLGAAQQIQELGIYLSILAYVAVSPTHLSTG